MAIVQILLNAVIAASLYALVGAGFALIFRTSKFFHFAHAATFTAGAYLTYTFKQIVGLSLPISVVFSLIGCGIVGLLMSRLLFLPLRRRGASSLVLLLSSLGLYVILQNSISLIYGDHIKSIRDAKVVEGIPIFGARITEIQIAAILGAAVLIFLLHTGLRYTGAGKALRAVASNPTLAKLVGVDSNLVVQLAFVAGSVLAGAAGILVALDIDMTPSMGMLMLMMGVVAVIIGGVRSLVGIAFGALLLGAAQNLGTWLVSSQWQDAIAFAILVVFLLVRPRGFVGG